jgi:dihydrofolate synthase/folylpolyglutamate synthase
VASALGAGPIWRVGGLGAEPGSPRGAPIAGRNGEAGEGIIGVRRAGEELAIDLPDGRTIAVRQPLAGAHQAANAAVAAGIAARAAARFSAIDDAAIAAGIAGARWPGRLERIEQGGVTVLLDCAHNPHGAAALAAYLRSAGIGPERAVLVFGALADKAWTGMLDALAPSANARIYAAPKGRAPASPSDLRARWPGEEAPEGRDAITRALALAAAQGGGVVVVAGSIYLVGEIRGALLGIPCDPVVAL